jgi:hypothetical protein
MFTDNTNSIAPSKNKDNGFCTFFVPRTEVHRQWVFAHPPTILAYQVIKSLVNSILNTYTLQTRMLVMH